MKFIPTIDKDIPYTQEGNYNEIVDWPFEKMTVGDSFFIPSDVMGVESVRTRASNFAKEHNQKYAVKKIITGCRVWRLK